MRYYIGLSIPHKDAMAIKYVQDAFNYQNISQPSVILVPPYMLPRDDIFVKDLIEICKNIHPFDFTINGLQQFDKKVIYLDIQSKKIISIRDEIVSGLNLEDDSNGFVPHLTILRKRYITNRNFKKINLIANNLFDKPTKYRCSNIVVYQQSSANCPYKPYIMINLE